MEGGSRVVGAKRRFNIEIDGDGNFAVEFDTRFALWGPAQPSGIFLTRLELARPRENLKIHTKQ